MADQRTRSLIPIGKFTDPAASGYLNSLNATVVALWAFFAKELWTNDMTRIVYASNDYSFMRRVELNAVAKTQGLSLPFQSFKISNVSPGTTRPWFNRQLAVVGIEDHTINKRIKLIPVTIEFESSLFFSTEADMMWTQSKLIWDASIETKIKSGMDLTVPDPAHPGQTLTTTLDNIGIVSMVPNYNPQFTEKDWLEKNKLRSIALDSLQVQTFIVHDDIRGVSYALTKEIIMQVYEMTPNEEFALEVFNTVLT